DLRLLRAATLRAERAAARYRPPGDHQPHDGRGAPRDRAGPRGGVPDVAVAGLREVTMEGRMMTGAGPGAPGMRHPEHDRLVGVVRTWYVRSYPEMGYLREARRFGVYTRNPRVPGGMANGALLRGVAAGQVPALLADLRDHFGGGPVSLVV